MKKIKYLDEEILEYTLKNGLKVYLYPTNKTKNFYITVSTHFGSEVMKYKKDNKTYEVTKGSAHFLEHRVMDFTKNKKAMEEINGFGSFVNAYTTYNGTNYNIYGYDNIKENMRLLFDRVFKAEIKPEDVEKERGIIIEEYNMYFDDPYFILHNNLNQNSFHKDFLKFPVLGTKEGIETVSTEELTRLYKDFYTPENMFIVVTGFFNENEVIEYIENYTKNIKANNKKITIIKPKEEETVKVELETINLSVSEPKIIVGYKTKIPDKTDKIKYKTMLNLALESEFSSTGNAYEELGEKGIKRIGYGIEETDKYILIYFKASTDKTEEFLNIVENHIKTLKIDEKTLERKKRGKISDEILAFEDILTIEDNITTDILSYKKLINNRNEIIKSITLSEINNLFKNLNLKNKSILKIENN